MATTNIPDRKMKIEPCPKCGGEDFEIEEDFLEMGKKIICKKCKNVRKI